MKIKLPDSISSKQDLADLIIEIRDYSGWFYHNGIKDRTNVKHIVLPPVLSPSALELIRSVGDKKLLSQQSLDDLIKTLEEYRDIATSLTITLAAPPTSDLKKILVAWCRENISPNILVSFGFNATLLGGMVVRYRSRIFDWSFRRQILAARNKFPEVLRRV